MCNYVYIAKWSRNTLKLVLIFIWNGLYKAQHNTARGSHPKGMPTRIPNKAREGCVATCSFGGKGRGLHKKGASKFTRWIYVVVLLWPFTAALDLSTILVRERV